MGIRDDIKYLKYRRWYEKKTAESRKFNQEYVKFQKSVISELGYAVPLDEIKTTALIEEQPDDHEKEDSS
jgi:hypothetical protein